MSDFRDIAFKAVMYSKSLNKYFVSDAMRIDSGLSCLFGFENEGLERLETIVLCSQKFIKEINEDWWDRDWVHIKNLQYTGLIDIKDVEIYEGDRVDNFGIKLEVMYQAPSFIMKESKKHKRWHTFGREPSRNQFVEVIGNIYENEEG